MASASSLYEVLGIHMGATGHEIKAAYRRLARTCHPDVVGMNKKESSTNEFVKIQAAYSTLSDPDKRASYDRDLFQLRRRSFGPFEAAAAAAASTSAKMRYPIYSTTCRNWETDQCW